MPKSYTTIQGDTWDLIAYKTLGNEYLMSELIDANSAYRETAIFSAGITLTIPDIPESKQTSLPPWKRE